jgi:hypothetical protein
VAAKRVLAGLQRNIENLIDGSKQARHRLATMLKQSVVCCKDAGERLARTY